MGRGGRRESGGEGAGGGVDGIVVVEGCRVVGLRDWRDMYVSRWMMK